MDKSKRDLLVLLDAAETKNREFNKARAALFNEVVKQLKPLVMQAREEGHLLELGPAHFGMYPSGRELYWYPKGFDKDRYSPWYRITQRSMMQHLTQIVNLLT